MGVVEMEESRERGKDEGRSGGYMWGMGRIQADAGPRSARPRIHHDVIRRPKLSGHVIWDIWAIPFASCDTGTRVQFLSNSIKPHITERSTRHSSVSISRRLGFTVRQQLADPIFMSLVVSAGHDWQRENGRNPF